MQYWIIHEIRLSFAFNEKSMDSVFVIPDLYGCLPDSKKNLSYVVKKSAA
jgi:hypothetical protein